MNTTAKPHIELFNLDRGDGTNPTLRLSWCVSKETLDLLKEASAHQPYMLLVVSP